MGRRTSTTLTIAGALVVALAVVTAYALGTAGRSAATEVGPPADATQRTLTTAGQGTATGIPDELSFTVAVSRTEAEVSTAMASSSSRMRSVLHALRRVGVRAKDIHTTGLDVGPHYSYYGGSEHITGYTVSQRARVTVRGIGQGGKAIGLAARAGGDDVRIRSVSLDIADRDALLAQARRAAVRDAMTKARQYAGAGRQHVGSMVSLSEVHTASPAPVPVAYEALDGMKHAAAVPVRAGRQGLTVRVRVVWSLD